MKLLIACGGTGGHIFPGLAVAEEWKMRNHSFDILFVGSKEGMENELVPSYGFTLVGMNAVKIKGKSVVHTIKAIIRLPFIMTEAYTILKKYKPDFVLGMGGYASFFIILVAEMLGNVVCIHEQNSIPGLANRILGKFATRVFITFPQSRNFFKKEKTILSGNPLRKKIVDSIGKGTSETSPFRIFITGGSQGAHSLNKMIHDALPLLAWAKNQCVFIHQAGKFDEESIRQVYKSSGFNATVRSFFENMGEEYQKASVVITRSGAGIMEMAAHGKCLIVIPFPYSADGHQHENARYFVDNGAADLITESKDAHKELAQRIRFYFDHPEKRNEREKKAQALARVDGAKVIVNMLLGLGANKEAYV